MRPIRAETVAEKWKCEREDKPLMEYRATRKRSVKC